MQVQDLWLKVSFKGEFIGMFVEFIPTKGEIQLVQLQMGWLSLRTNWFNFKTLDKLPPV